MCALSVQSRRRREAGAGGGWGGGLLLLHFADVCVSYKACPETFLTTGGLCKTAVLAHSQRRPLLYSRGSAVRHLSEDRNEPSLAQSWTYMHFGFMWEAAVG